MIENFIALEKIRYDDRLTVSYEAYGDVTQCQIPPMLLLPFVENAFKHGVGETRFEAVIDIALELQDRKLKFTIKNSKDEDQNTVNQGIGLKNVKRQLELIYGENYSLEIESESKVFFVKLTIQLSPHEE